MPVRLSVDALQLILDEIFVWKDEPLWHLYGMRGRRSWLASTLSVSHEWYLASLPRLYWLIEIGPGDETTLDLLLRTLRRRPEFASHVRVVRPYERDDRSNDPYNSLSDIFKRDEPNIPFITRKGRSRWVIRRRVRKFGTLLNLCTNLDEIFIDSFDIPRFSPVFKQVAGRLRRLVLNGTYRLDVAQFALVGDWSYLRSLRLDASGRYDVGRARSHNQALWMEPTCFAQMTHLVELEVVGKIPAQGLHDILHIVRGTLRSLMCNNISGDPGPEYWLSPVRNSLRKLKLQICDRTDDRLGNLTYLTALRELHIIVSWAGTSKSGNVPPPAFPRGVERMVWSFSSRSITPANAQERVRELLASEDFGSMHSLQSVVIHATMHDVEVEEHWSSVGTWIQLEGSRLGLDCYLVLEKDCSYFQSDDPRDIFALSSHTNRREREWVRKVQEAVPQNFANRCVGAMAADAWAVCCCISLLGCNICNCAHFFE